MDAQEKLNIELACTRLINQFAVFNDAGRFIELVAMFTDKGEYARPIAPDDFIVGKPAILASFEARPKERIGRHLITNIVVDVQSPTAAKGLCYVTLYSGTEGQKAEKFGLQAQASQLVGEYHDDFVLTGQGWKFARRKGCIIFST